MFFFLALFYFRVAVEIITARMGSVRGGRTRKGTIKRREGDWEGDIQTHHDITATII